MIRLNQIKISVFSKVEFEKELLEKCAKEMQIYESEILSYKVFKESLDARKKHMKISYTVDVVVRDEEKVLRKGFEISPNYEYNFIEKLDKKSIENKEIDRPIVIGFGPAGIFNALILAEAGLRPIVYEMGEKVDDRTITVDQFWEKGLLDEKSNVQFGEGGAGTFSDGKLTTRTKDPRCRKVLNELVKHGAPKEILYKNKPHVGTDVLKGVIKSIRGKIIDLGGEINFSSEVTNFEYNEGTKKIELNINNNSEKVSSDNVVLAIGHSSRNMFQLLKEKKVSIKAKPFAVGIRIEHKQNFINKRQYKDPIIEERFGAAEYRLSHTTKDGRGVYSFCMCPGGLVVGASSEKDTVVVNGMSYQARDKDNANSAILVSVTPDDFKGDDPLRGMYFQRELEKKAFEVGGSNYSAPVMKLGDFLGTSKQNNQSKISREFGEVKASYTPSVKFTDISQIFPKYINDGLKEGIKNFESRISGFADENVIITGVESRSSSPIIINRDTDSLESISTAGLYPCGEGAGYAGGIMSSAVDGIKVAEKIIESVK